MKHLDQYPRSQVCQRSERKSCLNKFLNVLIIQISFLIASMASDSSIHLTFLELDHDVLLVKLKHYVFFGICYKAINQMDTNAYNWMISNLIYYQLLLESIRGPFSGLFNSSYLWTIFLMPQTALPYHLCWLHFFISYLKCVFS